MIDVVGIGAAGWDSLARAEQELVRSAAQVFGSRRQLDLLPSQSQTRTPWPSPLLPGLAQLMIGHEQRATVVLASGDPLLAGLGSTLVQLLGTASVRVHPGVSSVALARARMGWAAETVDVVRLNESGADRLRSTLSPGRRVVVLSRDISSPVAVATVLVDTGLGASQMTVLSDLGSSTEQRIDASADAWTGPQVPSLHLVCVECVPTSISTVWSHGAGLADDAYEHDGQLTKRDVRAAALAHLMPVPGQLLWDVGAGAGSVGIEWLRSHPSCRAIAVERDAVRGQRIRRNAARLGVPDLRVVQGAAPEALGGLPRPDAVFVGGGTSAGTLDLAWAALNGGGRLVVHAVTQETEAVLFDRWRVHGGELTRISVEHLEPIGSYSGWKPARAVVQWSVQKPLEAP